MARFTEERRAEFLTLLRTGRNVEEAAAEVGVSRATITKWAARGRAGDPGAVEFAASLDAIRDGGDVPRLSEDDVVRMVEKSARNGSVQAMKLLLDRFEKEKRGDEDSKPPADPLQEFDELAQKRRGRAA